MSTINVLTFGMITEIVGNSSFVLSNVSSTGELKEKLENDFPGLKNINYAIAVNKKIVNGPMPLPDQVTVALLPPFSGG